jgi:hypothetical protein
MKRSKRERKLYEKRQTEKKTLLKDKKYYILRLK